jgi:hypothetical protein
MLILKQCDERGIIRNNAPVAQYGGYCSSIWRYCYCDLVAVCCRLEEDEQVGGFNATGLNATQVGGLNATGLNATQVEGQVSGVNATRVEGQVGGLNTTQA